MYAAAKRRPFSFLRLLAISDISPLVTSIPQRTSLQTGPLCFITRSAVCLSNTIMFSFMVLSLCQVWSWDAGAAAKAEMCLKLEGGVRRPQTVFVALLTGN